MAKLNEVHVGDVWTCKVSGTIANLKITHDLGTRLIKRASGLRDVHQGFAALNLATKRVIRVRTPQRLRERREVTGVA